MQFPAFRSEEWMREVAFAPLSKPLGGTLNSRNYNKNGKTTNSKNASGCTDSTYSDTDKDTSVTGDELLKNAFENCNSTLLSRRSTITVAGEKQNKNAKKDVSGRDSLRHGVEDSTRNPATTAGKRESTEKTQENYTSERPLYPPDFCFANLELLPPYLVSFPTAALYRERMQQVQRSIKRALFRQSLFKIQNVEVLEVRRCPAPRKLLSSEVVYDFVAAQEEKRRYQRQVFGQKQTTPHLEKQRQDQQSEVETSPLLSQRQTAMSDTPEAAAALPGAIENSSNVPFRKSSSTTLASTFEEGTTTATPGKRPLPSTYVSAFAYLWRRLFISSSTAHDSEKTAAPEQREQRAVELQQRRNYSLKSQQEKQEEPQYQQEQRGDVLWRRLHRWALDDNYASSDKQLLLREEIWTVDRCSSLRKYRVQVYQAMSNAKEESPGVGVGNKFAAGQQQRHSRGNFYSVSVEPLAISDKLRQFYFHWRDASLSGGSSGGAGM